VNEARKELASSLWASTSPTFSGQYTTFEF